MRPFDCDTAGLFEGYGGLTMATRQVFGGDLGWYSEIEPAACRLLEHHHPAVPNLGDITQVDWSEAPRPRRLTGGFPCQDVSPAGRRLGLRPGTRSGLWTHFAYAIDQLRPELVVIENVRGLLSAEAACDLEPCPWCVGDGAGKPLRALGAVLGDLADLGYDAQWHGRRAADDGAPHGRFRIFILAWPRDSGADAAGLGCGAKGRDDGLWLAGLVPVAVANAGGGELQRRRVGGVVAGPEGPGDGEGAERERDRDTARDGRQDAADADSLGPLRSGAARGRRRGPADHDLAAADASSDGWNEGRPESARLVGRSDAAVGSVGAAANAVRDGREGRPERDLGTEAGQPAPLGGNPAGRVLDWGVYEPAIRRWEHILGRVAPAPTMTGKRGGQQLSPAFVEWMQGLPDGHVTAVPGLSRNEQLKMLGNGVVPQQAAAALTHMLASFEAAAA